jgi:hypothetical protein
MWLSEHPDARHPDPEEGGGRGEKPESADFAEWASVSLYGNEPGSLGTASVSLYPNEPGSFVTCLGRLLPQRARIFGNVPRDASLAGASRSRLPTIPLVALEADRGSSREIPLVGREADRGRSQRSGLVGRVTSRGRSQRSRLVGLVTSRGRSQRSRLVGRVTSRGSSQRSRLVAVVAPRGPLREIRGLRLFSAPPFLFWVGMPGIAMPRRSRCSELT